MRKEEEGERGGTEKIEFSEGEGRQRDGNEEGKWRDREGEVKREEGEKKQ